MSRLATVVLTAVTCVWTAHAAAATSIAASLQDRFSVGVRYTYFDFTGGTERMFAQSGEFIGGFTEGISIDRLDEIQNSSPTLYGRCRVFKYVAIEVGQEKLRGDARTYYGHSDGELDVDGLSLQILGTLPNRTPFEPYVGAGVAFLDAEFDHAPWGQGVHIIDTEDGTRGLVASAGCGIRLWKGLSIDIIVRYMQADIDAHFHWVPDDRHYYWTFPIDNWAGQAGVKWTF